MSNAINLQPAYRSIIYSTTSSESKAKGAPTSGVLHIYSFLSLISVSASVCLTLCVHVFPSKVSSLILIFF